VLDRHRLHGELKSMNVWLNNKRLQQQQKMWENLKPKCVSSLNL
jgi:hypothetical protein